MSAITRININNLFWLGRYVERVFITLNSFFRYSDRLIENGDELYRKYLEDISVPNIYKDAEDFFDRYLFDPADPNSIRSNLDRALGNGIVLREEIKTPSLSYLQMAADRFSACKGTKMVRYDMLPVRDAIYAFWGSVDSNMTDTEALRVIHLGKSVEKTDMYLRLSYPAEEVGTELDNLMKHVSRYADQSGEIICLSALTALKLAPRTAEYFQTHKAELIGDVERLIEVNTFETAAV